MENDSFNLAARMMSFLTSMKTLDQDDLRYANSNPQIGAIADQFVHFPTYRSDQETVLQWLLVTPVPPSYLLKRLFVQANDVSDVFFQPVHSEALACLSLCLGNRPTCNRIKIVLPPCYNLMNRHHGR